VPLAGKGVDKRCESAILADKGYLPNSLHYAEGRGDSGEFIHAMPGVDDVADRPPTAAVVARELDVPVEGTLDRCELLANRYDYDFGRNRVFPQLVAAVLAEIPDEVRMLELGAATGPLTGPLLMKARRLTALEPSSGMLRRLLPSDVADDPRLGTMSGVAEDLDPDAVFDVAVVAFCARHGIGLLRLLVLLAGHVRHRVVMLLDNDGSLDCAYLARAASLQGFDVRVHLVGETTPHVGEPRRAAVLVADVEKSSSVLKPEAIWEFETRTLDVPYPAPRGAATELVRDFLDAGERALLIHTDARGIERLYGNLRTAIHRLGREEVTARRTEEGIQIVRLPKATD
jgi:hypothetical protein